MLSQGGGVGLVGGGNGGSRDDRHAMTVSNWGCESSPDVIIHWGYNARTCRSVRAVVFLLRASELK